MNTSQYRREFADYSSALELAHYQHRAGLEPELDTEPIYERYGDLFTRQAIEDLKRALDEAPPDQETERAGLHALCGAARIGYLERHAREATDERALCESKARVEWEGASISAHSVPKKIGNEPKASRRSELMARWIDAIESCNDLRATRLESFQESARTLGFDSYRALFTEVTGTDYEKLAASARAFLEQTEGPYMSALSRATARDLKDVERGQLGHADFLFFQRMPRLDPFFPARDALKTYAATMRDLGISVEQQKNIHIDDEQRPLKNPRAACFRVRVPDDVRLLLAPIGGAYDYTTLFHEAGHAQHFGWASRELAARHPEFVYSSDHATTEAYAFLFNYLFQDPVWLVEHRAGTSPEQARDIVRDLALLAAHTIRRSCAKLNYEIALYDSPQMRSEQLSLTYARLQTEATGFRRHPSLYLWDVDDGFYAAAYLRAWAFEAGLREHLRTRWGRRWWASRKAGDELIDLWNTASRYTVEELAQLIGFGEISFDFLARTLIEAMRED
ncbi:MAG TPA: hypothetical protein VGX92_02450 [Pyrinomonadaceae bacterium]|jgi:hypothetical protein|nr:hypothetical protein [Pyrinomonadaceae bacterium]